MGSVQEQIQSAMAKQRAGDLDAAERELRAVLERSPGMPMACAILGSILNETGRAPETVEMLGPIAEREPDRPLVRMSLGMALNRVGRAEEALEHLDAACAINPTNPQALFWRGATLERLDRIEDAGESFQLAITAASGNVAALAQLGERLHQLGRFELSARCFENAIAGGASGAPMLLRLASSYQSLHQYDNALDAAKRALVADPKNPTSYMVIADIHEKTHTLEKGAASAREGLRLVPTHTVLSRILARLERRMGRAQRAVEVTDKALSVVIEDPRLLGPLLIERGHALDALGEYDRAFEAFARGKAAWLETTRQQHDLGTFPAQVAERREAARALPHGATLPDDGIVAPVFFVGFPRSGTTLMEQVLRAHPRVATLDEVGLLDQPVAREARKLTGKHDEAPMVASLSDAQIVELRRSYIEAAEESLGKPVGGRVLIDKLPLHITRIGLIRRLFPEARLLVALRDPRDCCVSGFMQSFDANDAMVHFHSVEAAARLYSSVMDLWLEARAEIGEPYLEYRYEDLTLDFEATVRRVLDFLGLDWTDDVLRFQEGARKRAISTPSYERVVAPIDRKSVARWRNYEKHLGAALDILRPYVEAFGYED